MKVYIDSENKCYADAAPGRIAVETDFFAGKCKTFIEGYKLFPHTVGECIYPYKPYELLEAAQMEYEQIRAELEDMQAALALLGVTV